MTSSTQRIEGQRRENSGRAAHSSPGEPTTSASRLLALPIRSGTDEFAGVVIEVQDSGVGLDPEHVNRILDPFFSTEPGGLGMELAIIRSIVQVHAERLRARPNDGAGVTMHVALPAGAGDAR